jgi:flagellar basal body-associated protein FliL
LRNGAGGYLSTVTEAGRKRMPMWVWILIIVLLVLLLFGGVGYGRRGGRV